MEMVPKVRDKVVKITILHVGSYDLTIFLGSTIRVANRIGWMVDAARSPFKNVGSYDPTIPAILIL